MVDEETASFVMHKGVRQGCVLGPILLIIVLAQISQEANLNEEGLSLSITNQVGIMKLSGEQLPRKFPGGEYADDMALLSTSRENLQNRVQRLADKAMKYGLKISTKKTQTMWLAQSRNHDPKERVTLNGEPLEMVSEFNYLGSIIAGNDSNVTKEIKTRICRARRKFNSLNFLWNNNSLSRRIKVRLLNTFVLPVLLYACETWNTRQVEDISLQAFINSCTRRFMGWSIWDKNPNKDLHKKILVPAVDKIIPRRRILLALHVNVGTNNILLKTIQFGTITSLSCVSGRRKQSWSNRLTRDLNGSEDPEVTYDKLLRLYASSRKVAKLV